MSFDWTKEELLRELKEREEAGEAKEVTFDFIWAVVERAYKERDQFVGLPQRPTNRWAKYCDKDYFDVEKKRMRAEQEEKP